jgi:hypothetical protein
MPEVLRVDRVPVRVAVIAVVFFLGLLVHVFGTVIAVRESHPVHMLIAQVTRDQG